MALCDVSIADHVIPALTGLNSLRILCSFPKREIIQKILKNVPSQT